MLHILFKAKMTEGHRFFEKDFQIIKYKFLSRFLFIYLFFIFYKVFESILLGSELV